MTLHVSRAPQLRQSFSARFACAAALAGTLLFAACSGEDEGTRLQRELTEAQTAMAFCDRAPANCDIEELGKRNAALSSAETNMSNFQKRD